MILITDYISTPDVCHIRDEKGALVANVYPKRAEPSAIGFCEILIPAEKIAEEIVSLFNTYNHFPVEK